MFHSRLLQGDASSPPFLTLCAVRRQGTRRGRTRTRAQGMAPSPPGGLGVLRVRTTLFLLWIYPRPRLPCRQSPPPRAGEHAEARVSISNPSPPHALCDAPPCLVLSGRSVPLEREHGADDRPKRTEGAVSHHESRRPGSASLFPSTPPCLNSLTMSRGPQTRTGIRRPRCRG